jgi:molybdopterin synthase catalytic subunit/molybdopterin converting factor small subunit
MHVKIRLFARYREAAGLDRVDVELPEDGTVEAAWSAVAQRFPLLGPYRPFTLFALGHEYVKADHPLQAGDELCLFPPVSGGGGSGGGGDGDLVRLVAEPIDERAFIAGVEDREAGAIALFSGVVRDQTGGRRVKFLEYEAHGPMAEHMMREIVRQIRERWPAVRRVAIVHRFGRLEIGESSVVIAVSSPHRRQAFEACQYAIDTLKETVPIWKKEHFEDGEVWVGLQSECAHRH